MHKLNEKVINKYPFIYVPERFDPAKYGGAIAKHPDAARWLLSTVYIRRLLRNYNMEVFLNLHSVLLGLVMGDINCVRPVRQALVQHGLIECDYEYFAGKKSLGYRIGPALRDVRWE